MKAAKDKRTTGAAGDVHAEIAETAAYLHTGTPGEASDASEFPGTQALLFAIADKVAAAVPRSVALSGRRYWLRVGLALEIEVFATPGEALPLLSGVTFSTAEGDDAPGAAIDATVARLRGGAPGHAIAPDRAALMKALRADVSAGVPRYVEFHGRMYWPRVHVHMRVEVFAAPGGTLPLLSGLMLSTTNHGHAPGH